MIRVREIDHLVLRTARADEMIAFDVLTGRAEMQPDLTVLVLDASNLERNLYLALQIIELSRPVLVALNMMDEAARQGLEIDHEVLGRELGATVVPVVARKGEGLDELRVQPRPLEADSASSDPGRAWS